MRTDGRKSLHAAAQEGRRVAGLVGCPKSQVMTGATGVIGEPLPMGKLRGGIDRAHAALRPAGLAAAAEAIRTTDTVAKTARRSIRIGEELVTLVGMAKGSGMIEPRMATMLAYVFTDAAVEPGLLRSLVRRTADATFNRLSIDGETSRFDARRPTR